MYLLTSHYLNSNVNSEKKFGLVTKHFSPPIHFTLPIIIEDDPTQMLPIPVASSVIESELVTVSNYLI